MKFIHRRKFAADLGISDAVFDGWKKRHWDRGKHYIIVGRQILVNLWEVNQWLEKESVENLDPESGSREKELGLSMDHKANIRSCSTNRTRHTMQGILKPRKS